MSASVSKPQGGHHDGKTAPRLALTHGQTLWLLNELGLRQNVGASTFNYYVKSLRRLGVPFDKGKGRSRERRHVTYDFEDLMELTVALLLRVYGWLPDAVLAGLRSFRGDLRPIYRQAYSDLAQHVYPAARISTPAGDHLSIEGLFLDLNIRYSAGRLIEFGPPRVVSPFEALCLYAQSGVPARAYLPLNVSVLAELIVNQTRVLPPPRRKRGAAGGPVR
jgi:hypothetical protein